MDKKQYEDLRKLIFTENESLLCILITRYDLKKLTAHDIV